MNQCYIIGAGGVGSWLTPALCLLLGRKGKEPVIIDGDKLEEKNLNRQLFEPSDVGRFKAEALAQRYGCSHINKWFTSGLMQFDRTDVLLVAVDNHLARMDALITCDREGCMAIIGANETTSSEAYVYFPEWQDTNRDPRVFYPEIRTDKSGDPRAAAIGCTGEAQVQTPQLVTANYMAAGLMQHLFLVWVMEKRKFDRAAQEHLPHKLWVNLTRIGSDKTGVPAPVTKEEHASR